MTCIATAQSSLDCLVLTKLKGKTIILGVLDLSTHQIKTPEIVAERIRRAPPYVRPECVIVTPDCGMKYSPRNVAFEKSKAMVAGQRCSGPAYSPISRYLARVAVAIAAKEGKITSVPMQTSIKTSAAQAPEPNKSF